MAPRPLTIGLRTRRQRHLDAVAGIVACASHFCEIPSRSQVSRAPFTVRLEPAGRQNYRSRAQRLLSATDHGTNTFDAVVTTQQISRTRAVADLDAMLRGRRVLRLHQAHAAAIGVDHHTAEKLEPAVMVVRLPSVVGDETNSPAAKPLHRVRAVLHDNLGKLWIDVVLGDAE